EDIMRPWIYKRALCDSAECESGIASCVKLYRWNIGAHEYEYVRTRYLDCIELQVPPEPFSMIRDGWDYYMEDPAYGPALVGEWYDAQMGQVATLWELVGENVNTYDLNDLIVGDPVYPLRSARSIDAMGRIVGIARELDRNAETPHAFLAMPVDRLGVGPDADASAADRFQLRSSSNPFAERTMISFNMPESAPVRVTVHDLLGREIARLADGWHAAGRHERAWMGRSQQGVMLPAGTYWIRLQSGSTVESREVVIPR
ncbi:FlgD immunoglobulin-like domain containing protein, partial [Candidatus Eisenbacteria bacterium]